MMMMLIILLIIILIVIILLIIILIVVIFWSWRPSAEVFPREQPRSAHILELGPSPCTLLYTPPLHSYTVYTPPFHSYTLPLLTSTLQNVRCCMCWVVPLTIQNVQYTHKHRLGHCTNIHRDSWSLCTVHSVHSVLLDTGHMLDTFKYRMYLCHKYNGRCTYIQGWQWLV